MFVNLTQIEYITIDLLYINYTIKLIDCGPYSYIITEISIKNYPKFIVYQLVVINRIISNGLEQKYSP
jgi:hypothetical protein